MSGLANRVFPVNPAPVSISLSSGFSFQVIAGAIAAGIRDAGFHLVIERLFISGRRNGDAILLIANMFPSRYRAAFHFRKNEAFFLCTVCQEVSISLSSGFSFQVGNDERFQRCFYTFQSRYRAASHFRCRAIDCYLLPKRRFNLVIERLLISGLPREVTPCASIASFHLVIERLFISGQRRKPACQFGMVVSISLSSGFSFQALSLKPPGLSLPY